jgi:hypothetical protein
LSIPPGTCDSLVTRTAPRNGSRLPPRVCCVAFRDATDKLVKCLAPKAGPKNRAKKLVKTGEKMQEVDRSTVRKRGPTTPRAFVSYAWPRRFT